jgi:hypothetical protein
MSFRLAFRPGRFGSCKGGTSLASACTRPFFRTLSSPSAPALFAQPRPLALDELLYAADGLRLSEKLAAEKRPTIPWGEYLCICSDLAISDERAILLASDMQRCGRILHTGGAVCIRPREVLSHLLTPKASAMLTAAGPVISQRMELARAELAKIDDRARLMTNRILVGAGIGLTVQSAILFRLTFWEWGWDVVEPLSYFLNVGTTLGWYWLFCLKHREASYMSADAMLYSAVRARYLASAGSATTLGANRRR